MSLSFVTNSIITILIDIWWNFEKIYFLINIIFEVSINI